MRAGSRSKGDYRVACVFTSRPHSRHAGCLIVFVFFPLISGQGMVRKPNGVKTDGILESSSERWRPIAVANQHIERRARRNPSPRPLGIVESYQCRVAGARVNKQKYPAGVIGLHTLQRILSHPHFKAISTSGPPPTRPHRVAFAAYRK